MLTKRFVLAAAIVAQCDDRSIQSPTFRSEPVVVIKFEVIAKLRASSRIDPEPCGRIVGRRIAHR